MITALASWARMRWPWPCTNATSVVRDRQLIAGWHAPPVCYSRRFSSIIRVCTARNWKGLGCVGGPPLGTPAHLSGTPMRLGTPTPVPGGNTRTLLQELGYATAEI